MIHFVFGHALIPLVMIIANHHDFEKVSKNSISIKMAYRIVIHHKATRALVTFVTVTVASLVVDSASGSRVYALDLYQCGF